MESEFDSNNCSSCKSDDKLDAVFLRFNWEIHVYTVTCMYVPIYVKAMGEAILESKI